MADLHRDGNVPEERERLKRMESGRTIECLFFLGASHTPCMFFIIFLYLYWVFTLSIASSFNFSFSFLPDRRSLNLGVNTVELFDVKRESLEAQGPTLCFFALMT